jgi:hypothetical protein
MSKISTYNTVTPVVGDKVIGTDSVGTPTDATKNFLVEDIAALAGTGGYVTLEQVLAAGNTATNNITLTGSMLVTGKFDGLGTGDIQNVGTIDASGVCTLGSVSTTALTVTTNATFGTVGGVNTFQTAATFNGGATIPVGQNLWVDGPLLDGVSAPGSSGQMLTSTGTTVSWIKNNWEGLKNTMIAYADDAAAGVAGLTGGDMYVTDGTGAAPLNVAGIMMVKQ